MEVILGYGIGKVNNTDHIWEVFGCQAKGSKIYYLYIQLEQIL